MRFLSTLLILVICSCAPATRPFVAPTETEGGWKLRSSQPSQAPEWMSRLGLKQALELQYAGPIETTVSIYELSSDAAALECTQLWRTTPSEDRFHQRNLFVVVRSPHPNKEMLMDFSRALQKVLK